MTVLLQRGSRGNNVVALQEALSEAGYELECDGIFGANTSEAVKAFQEASELDCDGIAGPDTFAALGLEVTEEDDEGEQEPE